MCGSLTGTDEWRRSDAIATLGDGVCTLTLHVQTECLHDGTVCLHIETVFVHKSATTRARLRVYTTFKKPRAHDFFHWVCTCYSVCLSACFTLACPIFYFNLNLSIVGLYSLYLFILFLLYFSLCNKCRATL